MNSVLINKYSYMMDCLYEVIKITSNKELKDSCEKNLVNFINGLYSKEKTNNKDYELLFKKYNLNIEELIKFDNKKDTIKEKLAEYERELESIFENPNKESIKVWLDNIKDYSEKNKIKKEEIDKFIIDKFKFLDKENEFKNIVDKYISNDLLEENLESKDVENKIDKYEEANRYVYDNIYINNYDKYGKELQNILIKLNNDLGNNDIELVYEDVDNYIEFVKNNSELDKEKLLNHLEYTFKENDKKEILDDYYKNVKSSFNNKVNEKVLNDKSFTIKNIKKSYNSKIKNKSLALKALVGLGVLSINPLFGIGIGIGGYYLYKKGIKEADKLIVESGYSLNENEELIDKSNNIITKQDIGKLKYTLIKEQLMKNVYSGNIDKDYKKNRLTSLLLNNSIIKNIKNSIDKLKDDNYESSQLVKDFNKGMRKV